jgi:Uma2 family endonuclease
MARQSIDAPVTEEQRLPMSYEEWLAWAGESTQSEWVDGEAIVFMPPKTVHALISGWLFNLLWLYTDLLDLGQVIQAPFEMRLAHSAREPDILFIARRNLERLTPERLLGPADLVVELVSDDSVTRDRRDKLAEYAAAGVPEYWLFDPRPRRQTSAFFLLTEEGDYRAAKLDEDGRYHSAVLPGFWLDPAWLWREPLPNPLPLLAAIAPDALRASLLAAPGDSNAAASS